MFQIRKNSIPFIVLTLVHILILGITLKKRNRKQVVIQLLSNMGMAYMFEYLVLNLFKAYTYYPKIIKVRKLDNILGAILSQAFYVPIGATFITFFKLHWKGKLFFTIFYSMIEIIFIKYKLYKTHWWKPLYTIIFIPIYFQISDKWYVLLQRKDIKIVKEISNYLLLIFLNINVLYIFVLKYRFKAGFGRYHSWDTHFVMAPLYSMVNSLLVLLITKSKNIVFQLVGHLVSSVVVWFMYKLQLIQDKKMVYRLLSLHTFTTLISRKLRSFIFN